MTRQPIALIGALILFVAYSAAASAAALPAALSHAAAPAVELAGLKGAMAAEGALVWPVALFMALALSSLYARGRRPDEG